MKDELSTEERIGVVAQLIHEDVVFLALSGGEPLLREDIYEVEKRASDEGIFVYMEKNGTLLTKKRVEKLVKYGVKKGKGRRKGKGRKKRRERKKKKKGSGCE